MSKGVELDPEPAVNDIEGRFVELLLKRKPGAKAHRSGWPDFLIEHEGKTIAVEVKNGTDKVRPRQRRMFEALERAGIRVYVWHPRFPDKLRPWRKHIPRSWWSTKATKPADVAA
jgi:hypothetical protein